MSTFQTEYEVIGANNYCSPLIDVTNEKLISCSFEKITVNYTPIFNTYNGQCFQSKYEFYEYSTDIWNLKKIDIEKRMIVIKNFLFYKKYVIEAITQNKIFILDNMNTIIIGSITLYVNDAYCPVFNFTVNAGFWHTNIPSYSNSYSFGFDIISLISYLQCTPYSTAIDQLYSFFESRKFIHRSSELSEKEFYEQEKNPISYNSPVFFDRFFCKFKNIDIVKLYNAHSRLIGNIWGITTIQNERVEIYFTFWRHRDSAIYGLYPLPPQAPYELYFDMNRLKDLNQVKDIFICDSSSNRNENNNVYNCLNAILYGGPNNLLETDLACFDGYSIHFKWQNKLSYAYLKLLARKIKESHIQQCIIHDRYNKYSLDELIKNPELLNIKQEQLQLSITDPNTPIQGASRKRVMILDPIIESGTITWLFAAEKAGKTLLALAIAQAVGTGDSSIGTWKSLQPKRVLYIDGEMPGDKLQSYINKIISGNGGDPTKQGRSFSTYLFAEEGFEYSSILDDKWQEAHFDELLEFDLIILDNYYTLHESLNPIELIRWMKKIALQNGTAFLVLDHTNSDGELQGSIVKRRAMDLGIKLQLLSKNTINIDFQYDRYGREHKAESFTLITCFTSSEISYHYELDNPDNTSQTIQLSASEEELLVIYILKKTGMMSKDISKEICCSQGNISKKLKKIGLNSDLEFISDEKQIVKQRDKIIQSSNEYLADKNKLNKLINKVKNIDKKIIQRVDV